MISAKVKGGCHKMWKSKRGKIFFKREMMGSIKCAIKYGKEKEKRDEF